MDGDGIDNGDDPDFDGDGTPDGIYTDIDPDGDIDNDGLLNINDPDMDGDGIPNGDDPDFDNDGSLDGIYIGIMGDEDYNIGTCTYIENSEDTCEDDQLMTHSLEAVWVWSSESYEYFLLNNVWYDPLGKQAKCQNIDRVLPCSPTAQVSFFEASQLIIVVAIVGIIYLFYWSWRKQKKKKSKSRKHKSKK